MKDSIVFKVIATMIVSFILVLAIFPMTDISILSNTDSIVILRYILSSCIVIIGLIIVFSFCILKKLNNINNNNNNS